MNQTAQQVSDAGSNGSHQDIKGDKAPTGNISEKKLAANRKNALKSTGPKSVIGKARSSRNSLKHGILATAPILPKLENRGAWKEHLDGLFKSIAPVGYLEQMLTVRLAIVSWRLSRVVRCEAEVASSAVTAAGRDLERDRAKEYGYCKPPDPAKARLKRTAAIRVVEMFETLGKMPGEKKLDAELATDAVYILSEEIPEETDNVSVPGIPDDDAEYDAFDDWTVDLVRKAVNVYATTAQMTTDAFLYKCILAACKKHDDTFEEEERGEHWELLVKQESSRRMLLEPDFLDKVARYESALERSFFRILHEIQRLQVSRSGEVVQPPAVIDVDLDVHQAGS